MIRVLYVGAADLARPNAGLDVASRSHFEEIAGDGRLSVTAISVSPLPLDPTLSPRWPARLFAADMPGLRGSRRLRHKLALLARGGILFHAGLVSDAARSSLRTALAEHPDVVVIDNVGALGNIALPRLIGLRLTGRSRLMVIAHDASAEVLHDRAGLQANRLRAFAIRLHALHCHLYESLVFALAHRVVFLSRSDRSRFRFLPEAKTEALCLLLDEPRTGAPPAADAAPGRSLVFIGSPVFFANAVAIEWLTRRFAPELQARMPDVQVLLVGRGTDRLPGGLPANMRGLGFVDEASLHGLLQASCGMLSPVVHGSGIKIKVMEAIAAGCAVFATRSSLRGYEFMALEPTLDIEDPAGSAARLCAVIADPVRLEACREHIRARWTAFRRERRGKLADAVHRLAATRRAA